MDTHDKFTFEILGVASPGPYDNSSNKKNGNGKEENCTQASNDKNKQTIVDIDDIDDIGTEKYCVRTSNGKTSKSSKKNNDSDDNGKENRVRATNFTALEDAMCTKAYLHASVDSINGSKQKAVNFKKNIEDVYKTIKAAQELQISGTQTVLVIFRTTMVKEQQIPILNEAVHLSTPGSPSQSHRLL